jgi:hypothetical protein
VGIGKDALWVEAKLPVHLLKCRDFGWRDVPVEADKSRQE